MTFDVNSLVVKAKRMARENEEQAAMSLANDLVEQYPNEVKVWSLRAYLFGRNGDYAEAVSDYTRAIAVNVQMEQDLQVNYLSTIDLFFNRGADKFALGDHQSAVQDFTAGLELCDQYNSDDYRETLYFWRAEALLKLGKKREALMDLAHVADDFSFWTHKLRTKQDLIADCG